MLRWDHSEPRLASSHPVYDTGDATSDRLIGGVTRKIIQILENSPSTEIARRAYFKHTTEIILNPASAHGLTEVLLYDCPSCTTSCSVAPDLVGLNVVCPNCSQEFTKPPQDSAADLQLPDAIPYFKSGNLKILKNHLNKLILDGELSKSDEIALTRAALMLGLKEKDFVELTKSEFLSHFNPILERASKTAHITDDDVEEINKFKIKYDTEPATGYI